jgi:hypothetical protein
VCEVWETIPGNHGGIPDATVENPAVVTIEAGTVVQPLTPVTVTNDYPTGGAELVKLVEGDAQEEFTAGPYLVRVNCWAPDQVPGIGTPFAGFPVAVEVFPDEPVGAELPVGTTCWFQESQSEVPEGVTVTYDPPNADGTAGVVTVPPVDPGDEVFGTVSVTNTFTTGSLVIEKTVSGPGAPAFSQGPFVFDVTCDYLAEVDVFSTTVTVEGSADGTPVESEPVTGLPIGAECTVTEIDSGGADLVTPPQTVTIEENEQANVAFVGVNNPFSAGSIAVVKQVDGTAADSDYVAGLEFTIAIECAVERDGEQVTVLDDEVTVAGDGQPVTVTDDAGDPVLIPLGARCWGTEAETFGATAEAIDHDSYANGVEVVADAAGGVQKLQIIATNTFDSAELAISKDAVNAPIPNATYDFTVTCTIPAADGSTTEVPLTDGSSPVSLSSGTSVTVSALDGARCAVEEPDPGAADVTIAESGGPADNDPSDGVVTLDGDRAVAVTNTFPSDTGSGGGGGGPLPITGTTVLSIIAIAAALLVTGGILVTRAKRGRGRPV